jgi:hypothetical protein
MSAYLRGGHRNIVVLQAIHYHYKGCGSSTLTFLLDKIPVFLLFVSDGLSNLAASSALFIVGMASGLRIIFRLPENLIDSRK